MTDTENQAAATLYHVNGVGTRGHQGRRDVYGHELAHCSATYCPEHSRFLGTFDQTEMWRDGQGRFCAKNEKGETLTLPDYYIDNPLP